MVRKFWLVIALVTGLGAVAATFHFVSPAPSSLTPAPSSANAVSTAPVVSTEPAATIKPSETAETGSTNRPVVAYDRYRAEMHRIRAARQEAQALQANERCIGSERFRKVGTAWERAGDC
jgi:hypothetical protein